jgi:hypothetical protein
MHDFSEIPEGFSDLHIKECGYHFEFTDFGLVKHFSWKELPV